MTDRELLELAAKAAGIEGYIHEWINGPEFIIPGENPVTWSPLQDDGDALRLLVNLGLEIYEGSDEAGVLTGVVYFVGSESRPKVAMEYHKDHDDAFSATRRAITRAAAEIQRAKEAA